MQSLITRGSSWIGGCAVVDHARQAHAAGKLGVTDAWIRAAPPGARMMAGYATLKNSGDAPLTILTVQSDAFRMTSLHETIVDNGVSKMRELHRLTIAPGATVALQPGGKHLMLMQPRQEIAVGEHVEVMFLLSDGARLKTRFDVVAPDSTISAATDPAPLQALLFDGRDLRARSVGDFAFCFCAQERAALPGSPSAAVSARRKKPAGARARTRALRCQHRDVLSANLGSALAPAGQDARRAPPWGAFLFGYFLLGKQEKVTRSQGCERNTQDASRFHAKNDAATRADTIHTQPRPSCPKPGLTPLCRRSLARGMPRESPAHPLPWRASEPGARNTQDASWSHPGLKLKRLAVEPGHKKPTLCSIPMRFRRGQWRARAADRCGQRHGTATDGVDPHHDHFAVGMHALGIAGGDDAVRDRQRRGADPRRRQFHHDLRRPRQLTAEIELRRGDHRHHAVIEPGALDLGEPSQARFLRVDQEGRVVDVVEGIEIGPAHRHRYARHRERRCGRCRWPRRGFAWCVRNLARRPARAAFGGRGCGSLGRALGSIGAGRRGFARGGGGSGLARSFHAAFLFERLRDGGCAPASVRARNCPVYDCAACATCFRRAGRDDAAAAIAAFGTEVDDPVGGLDHVEVVLDHDDRVAVVDAAGAAPSSSCSMSWKCRPVVGSSRMYSVRPVSRLRQFAATASRAAPRRRTAWSRSGRA